MRSERAREHVAMIPDGGAAAVPTQPASGVVLALRPLERLAARPYAGESACAVVDVQPSGHLFVACGGASVELRDVATGALRRAFEAPDVVLAARFSSSGRLLFTGGLDQRATAHDVASGEIVGETPKMDDFCDEIVGLGPSDRFAMASQRGELWIVDAATLRPVHRLLGPDPAHAEFGGLAASLDGRAIYLSLGATLTAFDARTGAVLWRRDEARGEPSRLAVTSRGDVLVAASEGAVALFETASGGLRARLPLEGLCGVSWPEGEQRDDRAWAPRPRACPRGGLVALQDRVGNLVLLDTATLTLEQLPREDGRAFVEDIAWVDGERLLLGASDSTLAVWSARPLACVMKRSVIVATRAG